MRAAASGGSCRIVNIAEFGGRRAGKAERIEKWIEGRIIEAYGDEYAAQNPLIRITEKFRALGDDDRLRLFRYAEDKFGCDTLDGQFWNMLERQPKMMDLRTGWQMVEERADMLLRKQFESRKKAGGMA